MKERLGLEFFKQLDRKTYKVLIDHKIIKAKGMLVDATVFPEEIKYPNDVGQWLVKSIKAVGKSIGKSYRTYCRRAKKQMLQYVRRNISQLKEAIEQVRARGQKVRRHITEKLEVA